MPALAERVAAKQELDRRECAADPCTLLERHISIEEPDGTVIPLTLWPFQRDAVRALHEDRAVIVLKARRLGLSWIFLAYALWLAVFHQGIRVLILCKTEGDASELLDRIRRMRDRLAEDPTSAHILDGLVVPKKVRDAVTTLDVGTSTIKALVGTPAAARSETAGLVLLDEFAFQRGAGEIWRAVLPTIEGGGRLGVISTGNGSEQAGGLGAEFAKQWARAKAGVSSLRALFFPWHSRPDRDEAWRTRTLAQLGDEDRFRTEYPAEEADAFTSPDSDPVYPSPWVAACRKLGAELDALPKGQRPGGPVWMGIDWGVHTHVLFARRTAAGGLYVFHEIENSRGDLEEVVAEVCSYLEREQLRVEHERFDAAEPILHGSFRKQFAARMGYSPQWLAIPFGKYKALALKYARMLAKRTHHGEQMRTIAISPTGCPVLLRQMEGLQWANSERGQVVKDDDHGPDAKLTLTAELAVDFYADTNPEG